MTTDRDPNNRNHVSAAYNWVMSPHPAIMAFSGSSRHDKAFARDKFNRDESRRRLEVLAWLDGLTDAQLGGNVPVCRKSLAAAREEWLYNARCVS